MKALIWIKGMNCREVERPAYGTLGHSISFETRSADWGIPDTIGIGS
jgi:hypothetical protein